MSESQFSQIWVPLRVKHKVKDQPLVVVVNKSHEQVSLFPRKQGSPATADNGYNTS